MKKISEIQNLITDLEQIEYSQLIEVKGGRCRDDKRRQRPGGGTTTTSPSSKSSFYKNYFC